MVKKKIVKKPAIIFSFVLVLFFLLNSLYLIVLTNNDVSLFKEKIEHAEMSKDTFNSVYSSFNSFSKVEINDEFERLSLAEWLEFFNEMCKDDDFDFCYGMSPAFSNAAVEHWLDGNDREDYLVYLNKDDFDLKIYYEDELVYSVSKSDEGKESINSLLYESLLEGVELKYDNHLFKRHKLYNSIEYIHSDSRYWESFYNYLLSGETYKKNPNFEILKAPKNMYYEVISYYENGYIVYEKGYYNSERFFELFAYSASELNPMVRILISFYAKIGLINFNTA